MNNDWQIQEFQTGSMTLSYPKAYHSFIRECLIYDVYRSYMLREGDIVIDLGAAIGEFTIPASKKVGKNGLVLAIEPNPKDFEMLEQNIRRNRCRNVLSINKGVAATTTEKRISFWGRNFQAHLDTLGNIMNEAGVDKDINFVKMDIEGYETEVIRNDIAIMKNADVISAELHNTRNEIDGILGLHGFKFKPLTKKYCVNRLVRNSLLSKPLLLMNIAARAIAKNPRILVQALSENDPIFDNRDPYLVTGTYLKLDSHRKL